METLRTRKAAGPLSQVMPLCDFLMPVKDILENDCRGKMATANGGRISNSRSKFLIDKCTDET